MTASCTDKYFKTEGLWTTEFSNTQPFLNMNVKGHQTSVEGKVKNVLSTTPARQKTCCNQQTLQIYSSWWRKIKVKEADPKARIKTCWPACFTFSQQRWRRCNPRKTIHEPASLIPCFSQKLASNVLQGTVRQVTMAQPRPQPPMGIKQSCLPSCATRYLCTAASWWGMTLQLRAHEGQGSTSTSLSLAWLWSSANPSLSLPCWPLHAHQN